MKLRTIILVLVLIEFNFSYAQSTNSLTEERRQRIDSFFSVLEQNGLFNGSVLIAEKGQMIYQHSFGYADFERRIANTDTTPFNLASVSKPFTAIAVLQLVQKGKLKLEDPVIKYLPDFPYPSVSIRHLLNHTSGLPSVDNFERPYIKDHPDEMISNEKTYSHLIALKTPLSSQPGEKWSYSNMGYITLALLVEKISKTPFDIYLKKNIFIPAGMKRTYVRKPDMPNTSRYIIPTMYDSAYKHVDSLDPNKIYTYYHLGGTYGPSNIVSTLQDLLKFDNALGKLISQSLLTAAFTPTQLNNGKTFYMGRSTRSYGLGWNVYTARQEPIDQFAFHDGHIIGITTMMHKNLTKQQTIIFYDNTDAPAFFQKIINISKIINDIPADPVSTTKSLVRLYGQALVEKGADYAITRFNELRNDTLHYYIDELEMNRLGYDLLGVADFRGHEEMALEVFKVNTILFPGSANVFDSYAEALMKAGKNEEAIRMYTKSLALNPANEPAKRNLKKLLQVNAGL